MASNLYSFIDEQLQEQANYFLRLSALKKKVIWNKRYKASELIIPHHVSKLPKVSSHQITWFILHRALSLEITKQEELQRNKLGGPKSVLWWNTL